MGSVRRRRRGGSPARLRPGIDSRQPDYLHEAIGQRETHIVVRRGTADLGKWAEDERPVLADQQAAIGGPAPASVVRAWLISVSLAQGGSGRGELGRLELVDGDDVVRVL